MSSENEFEQRCRTVLAAHVEAIDGQTLSRLQRARQAALATAAKSGAARSFRTPGLWLPGGVLAGAAVLVLAVWVARPVGPAQVTIAEASPVEDAEILSSSDGPDLYADDAEFYEWAGSVAAGGTG